jgi:2-phosphosulfolactate phosphatase
MTQPHTYLTRGHAGCALAGQVCAIAIVVDALRASTTLAALLDQGVESVQIIARVEDARRLAEQAPDALLVGERGGERLPGFHLGNSPLEVLASPRLDGRSAIFTSSNGAQRLTACHDADRILVGTVANANTVAEWARRQADATGRPVDLIAAGQFPDENFISPEDEATCAYLAGRIGLPLHPDAREAFHHWESELALCGLETIFRSSRHAQRLMEIGYGEDVLFCTRPDTLTSLPVVCGHVLLDGKPVGVEVRAMPADE